MTTQTDRLIAEVARLLAPQRGSLDNNPFAHMVQGVVVGVNLGGLDIQLRGMVNSTTGVRYLSSYTPGFGDVVWCLRFGSDIICIGDLVDKPGTEGRPTIEPWHEVGAAGEIPFENSWVNFGAPWETAAYAMQSDGWVRMKGMIKSGSVVSAFFTLPKEYRPPFLWEATVLNSDANVGIHITWPAGAVSFSGAGVNTWVSLNGVTWPTQEAWERTRDTHWFSLIRQRNLWSSDSSGINYFAQIFRRPDGWRYLKGRMKGGTATAGTTIAFTDTQPEDSAMFSQMLCCREDGVGMGRVDLRGLSGEFTRVIGGATADMMLTNMNYWARQGVNTFSMDPNYPHKSMQNWVDISEEVAWLNGWADYNNGVGSTVEWQDGEYMIDDFGIVHLRGLAQGASKTSNICLNLPAGFRPLNRQIFPAVRHSAGGGVQGRLDVYPNGDVELINAVANWHSLNGASFKAEQ